MRRSCVQPASSISFGLIFALGFLHTALAAAATPLPTTTELTLSSGNSVAVGTLVALRASVSSSGVPVSPGLVLFCNAESTFCEDVNILGRAQLTASGTASVNLNLPIGSHQIRAEFRGTVSNAPSSSSTQSLIVGGKYPTVTTFESVPHPGSFDVRAKVTSIGVPAQTGTLNFPDQANHLLPLRSSLVGSPTLVFAPLAGAPGSGPSISGAVADFNGDGKLDQLVYSISNNVTVLLGNGDGSFTAGATMPVGTVPDGIAVGDFNNDDILDFVVVNNRDGTAYIFLGNGDGSFSLPKAIPVGPNPNSISVGDFNSDGNVDLVVSSSFGTEIWLGNGKGGFTITSRSTLPQANSPLHVADINGDGIDDLVYTRYGFISVIYFGNGDGTFVEATTVPAPCSGNCVVDTVVADFNGDGKPDLAISAASSQNFPGGVFVVLGNGDGTFGSTSYSPSNLSPSFISVGDLNGDGKLDICVPQRHPTDSTDLFTDIFLGKGDGTFELFQTVTSNISAIGDFNGDGITDLALGSPTGVALAGWQTTVAANDVLLNGSLGIHNVFANYEGDANHAASLSDVNPLQGPTAMTTTTLSASPTIALGQTMRLVATVSPSVVDQDRATGTVTFSNGPNTLGVVPVSDGRAELSSTTLPVGSNISLTAYYSGSTEFNSSISLPVRLTTRGTLRPISTVKLSVTPSPSVLQGTVVTLSANVFDGASPAHTGLVIFYGSTSANPRKTVLGQAQLTPSGVATMRYRPPIGSLGFKAVYQGTNTLAASESAPQSLTVTGQVATTTTVSVIPPTYRADVTSYGLLAASGRVSFVDATDSNIIFATAPLISPITLNTQLSLILAPPQPFEAVAITVADFNGDGILDQAINDGPVILLGNPDGSFTQKSPIDRIYDAQSFAVADFNSDGVLDIAVLRQDYNAAPFVTTFLGRGDGTFIQQSTLTIGFGNSLGTGDFNGDGIPDLVTTSGFTYPVAAGSAMVLFGNGDGTFRAGPSTDLGENSADASNAVDFNGDGIPDVMVGLSLLLGKGDGTFATRDLSSIADVGCFYVSSVLEADFNGDGIPDILVGCDTGLHMLLGKGNATFTSFQLTVPQLGQPGFIYFSDTADLNGDAIPDLVSLVEGSSVSSPYELGVLLGKGDGTFSQGLSVPFPTGTYATGFAFGDFNGDGTADVLAGDSRSYMSEWFTTVTQTSQATATNVTLPGNGPQQVLAAYPGDATHLDSASATVPARATALTHQQH
jgi:hypothetical protein